jgi:hypothetical protein
MFLAEFGLCTKAMDFYWEYTSRFPVAQPKGLISGERKMLLSSMTSVTCNAKQTFLSPPVTQGCNAKGGMHLGWHRTTQNVGITLYQVFIVQLPNHPRGRFTPIELVSPHPLSPDVRSPDWFGIKRSSMLRTGRTRVGLSRSGRYLLHIKRIGQIRNL